MLDERKAPAALFIPVFNKAEEQALKLKTFQTLIETKFGTRRGSKRSAALYLQVTSSYLSNMMRGVATIPDKYIEKLCNVADVADLYPEWQTYMEGNSKRWGFMMTIKVPGSLRDKLDAYAQSRSHPEPEATAAHILGILSDAMIDFEESRNATKNTKLDNTDPLS